VKLITAWIRSEYDTIELIAAADEDSYDPAHFEERVADQELSYGSEARILEVSVPDEAIRALFPDDEP
jgi:hypothetical protein